MAAKLEKTGTPGVFRRHAGECARKGRCECSYVVVWRHRGQQRTSTHRTLAEAREAKGQIAAGDRIPASKIVFHDHALGWVADRDLSSRTRETYRRDLERHVFPVLGRYRLAEVESRDIRELARKLEAKGLKASSIRGILAPVKASLSTAVEDGLIRWNPAREVRVRAGKDTPKAKQVRSMTRTELGDVLGEIPDGQRLFFELLAHSGLRISEATGLEWRHVEFGATPKLLIRQQDCRGRVDGLKTPNSIRDLPLSPALARRLWALRRGRGATERVFLTDTGAPVSDRNLANRVLIPATERAGLGRTVTDPKGKEVWKTWITFHVFRHTCASMLFEHGRNIEQVSRWLGHADAAFTLRTYVHLMDDGMGTADFMDEVVRIGSQVNTGSTHGPDTAANEIGATPAALAS